MKQKVKVGSTVELGDNKIKEADCERRKSDTFY